MGFLDSVLKKKKAPEAEEAAAQPELPSAVTPKTNPLAKLKGLLDHLEKIILGLVLLAVAALSVLKLLAARKDVSAIDGGEEPVILGGSILALENERPKDLSTLIKKSKEDPDAISLKGTNHLVFNPRVWKEIPQTNGEPPLLVMDSPNEPLGISALQVSSITNFKAYLNARAFIGGGIIRHEFTWLDRDYPVVPYQMMGRHPLKTFFPQQSMASSFLSKSAIGWSADPRGKPKPLHGFVGQAAAYLRLNPEWELKVRFKAVSQASPAQMAAGYADPAKTVPNVVYDLDIIIGVRDGLYPYETNSVRVVSDTPQDVGRGYAADFIYETKYHRKMELKNFRVGRHLMIDGEVFRVFRITADSVSLVSDLTYGGNGKIFEKPFPPPVVAPPPAVVVPPPAVVAPPPAGS